MQFLINQLSDLIVTIQSQDNPAICCITRDLLLRFGQACQVVKRIIFGNNIGYPAKGLYLFGLDYLARKIVQIGLGFLSLGQSTKLTIKYKLLIANESHVYNFFLTSLSKAAN